MKCDTPFEKYSDLCDLFNEIFKTGNWGVTLSAYMLLLVIMYVECIYVVVGDYICCVHICCWWISLHAIGGELLV